MYFCTKFPLKFYLKKKKKNPQKKQPKTLKLWNPQKKQPKTLKP